MAIFTSVIFSEIRKKLANTVMYKRAAQSVMRGKPGHIKNPRTPEQLTQRAKMALLVDLSRRFAPVIAEGFRDHPANQSIYNAFVSANIAGVTVDDEYQASVKYTSLLCSRGIIDQPEVSATSNENVITVTQTAQESTGTGTDDDVVYAGFYESVQKSARLVKIGNRKATLPAEFTLPKKWTKENVHIYAFAVSKSKKRTSPTLYVELS